MALGAKLYVTFQRKFLAFWNPLDPYNWNPFGLIKFSDFLEFVDTLDCSCMAFYGLLMVFYRILWSLMAEYAIFKGI